MKTLRKCSFIPRASSLFCVLFLIGLSANAIHAQSGDGITDMSNPSVGKNTLQGHIYYPSGHPLDRRLRVEITSVQNGSFSTLTSDNGAFSFYRLGDATYNLTIDAGPDYEPVTESIPLDSGDKNAKVGQTITLQIQLKPRSSTTRPLVNNAELSGVPPAARELYTQAMSLALARDHKGAIEKLEKAVSIYHDFALALNELGAQYIQTNHLDKATQALDAALKIAPDAFLPHLNYGYVLLLEKKYTEAEIELHRASDKNANSGLAHLYRARALIRLQRDDEAEKELKRAIAIGGDEANLAHRYLGALYMQRHDNAQAISELETYLRLTPKADDANQIREIIKELRLTSQSK